MRYVLSRSAFLGLAMSLILASCGEDPTGGEVPRPVSSVAITPQGSEVPMGATTQLSATIRDGSGAVVTGRVVSWTSSDVNKATVNDSGLVTGIAAGDVTITASSEGKSGSSTVTVTFRIPAASAAVSLAVGRTHACALSEDGAAYCWGDNSEGQLGNGTLARSSIPVEVAGGLRFAAVSAAGNNSCALTREGAAYCWGANTRGSLGNGTTVRSNVPVPVSGGLRFASIDVGAAPFVCGVASTGAAYCWGDNEFGQIGTGSASPDPVTVPTAVTGGLRFRGISTGLWHSCAVAVAGEGFCWGNNRFGQVDGTRTDLPVAAPRRVYADLAFTTLQPGNTTTCGISGADTYCWGTDFSGSRGDGAPTVSRERSKVAGGVNFGSVRVGAENYVYAPACAVTPAGAGYCWGANFDGQLGTTAQIASCVVTAVFPCSYTPVPVAGGLVFEAVIPAGAHTCGITRDRRVFCWGSNTQGQLGNGTTTHSNVPVQVSGGIRFPAP